MKLRIARKKIKNDIRIVLWIRSFRSASNNVSKFHSLWHFNKFNKKTKYLANLYDCSETIMLNIASFDYNMGYKLAKQYHNISERTYFKLVYGKKFGDLNRW